MPLCLPKNDCSLTLTQYFSSYINKWNLKQSKNILNILTEQKKLTDVKAVHIAHMISLFQNSVWCLLF